MGTVLFLSYLCFIAVLIHQSLFAVIDCDRSQTWSLALKQPFQSQEERKLIAHSRSNFAHTVLSNHCFS